VLQFDHIRVCKDRFLRFSQNNSIGIHFKVEKHRMVKEMNRSLLEKIQCLLSNTQLDKLFWAEALKYASHFMNRMPLTAIGGKTLLDI